MTDEQKILYTLGWSIYQRLQPFNLTLADLKFVEQGLSDAAAGKQVVDVAAYGPKIQSLEQERAAQLGEQAKAAGQQYLDKAAAEPGATKLPSGIIIRQINPGTGPVPTPTDTVKVTYTGRLVNGKVFESSNGTPVEFQLNKVIPCWTEGLQQMKVGEKAQLVCPSELAYGTNGAPQVPPNSTLIFDVELIAVTPTAPGTPSAPPAPPTTPQNQ